VLRKSSPSPISCTGGGADCAPASNRSSDDLPPPAGPRTRTCSVERRADLSATIWASIAADLCRLDDGPRPKMLVIALNMVLQERNIKTVTTRILREVEAGTRSFQREREAQTYKNRQLLFKSLRLRSYIIEGGCSPYICIYFRGRIYLRR
jgi:hypothetical protein